MLFDTFIIVYGVLIVGLYIVLLLQTYFLNKTYSVNKEVHTMFKFKLLGREFKHNYGLSMFISSLLLLLISYFIGKYFLDVKEGNLIVATLFALIFIVIISIIERKYDKLLIKLYKIDERDKNIRGKNKYSKGIKKYYSKYDNNSYTKEEKNGKIMLYIGSISFIIIFGLFLIDSFNLIDLQNILIGKIAPMGILLLYDLLKYFLIILPFVFIGNSFIKIGYNRLNSLKK